MTVVTIEGRLGADPDLRFIPSGKAVANLNVVTDRRRKNPDTGEWESTETTWRKITCWGDLAENVAESLQKGDEVIIVGREWLEEWVSKDGDKTGVNLAVEAYTVGPALRRTKWSKNRAERTANATPDPWASGPLTEEPPF